MNFFKSPNVASDSLLFEVIDTLNIAAKKINSFE